MDFSFLMDWRIEIAGAFGGLMRSINKGVIKDPYAVGIDILTGSVLAHYLAPAVGEYKAIGEKTIHMISFFIGVIGIVIVDFITNTFGPVSSLLLSKVTDILKNFRG